MRRTGAAMAGPGDGSSAADPDSTGTTVGAPDTGDVEVLRTPSPDMRTSKVVIAAVLAPQAVSLAFAVGTLAPRGGSTAGGVRFVTVGGPLHP